VSFYAVNSLVYIGKGTVTPEANVTAKSVVLHFMKPYFKTGRHLTGNIYLILRQLFSEKPFVWFPCIQVITGFPHLI
jgi:hypothetical protein